MHLGGVAGGLVKSPLHFHWILFAKRGKRESFQIACKIAYILKDRQHRSRGGLAFSI